MTTITYTGDGQTKNFVFSFPFFTTSDVVVNVNDTTINSGFQLSPTDNPEPSDIPYSGGTIIFDTAPVSGAKIKISRNIGLTRIVDYQPTVPIDTVALNQDFSFVIEKLKDFASTLDDFATKYSDIVNLPDFDAFIQRLDNIGQQLTALGGVENIGTKTDISALQNATSFTADGRNTVIGWSLIDGDLISLNFLGTDAGTYTYTPEAHGLLTLVFVPGANSDVSIEAPYAKTIYNRRMTTGMRETILLPVFAGLEIKVIVPKLTDINYQRLFIFHGA